MPWIFWVLSIPWGVTARCACTGRCWAGCAGGCWKPTEPDKNRTWLPQSACPKQWNAARRPSQKVLSCDFFVDVRKIQTLWKRATGKTGMGLVRTGIEMENNSCDSPGNNKWFWGESSWWWSLMEATKSHQLSLSQWTKSVFLLVGLILMAFSASELGTFWKIDLTVFRGVNFLTVILTFAEMDNWEAVQGAGWWVTSKNNISLVLI